MTAAVAQPQSGIDWKIVTARHVVGVVVLLLAQSPATYRARGFLPAWLGGAIVVFAVAGIITGLAWLFFTKREAGKSRQTFTTTSWVLAALLLLGQWFQGAAPSPAKPQPARSTPSSHVTPELCHSQGKAYSTNIATGPACVNDPAERRCTQEELAELNEASVTKDICVRRGDNWSEQAGLCFKKSSPFLPACKR